jgi:hypothetical protein
MHGWDYSTVELNFNLSPDQSLPNTVLRQQSSISLSTPTTDKYCTSSKLIPSPITNPLYSTTITKSVAQLLYKYSLSTIPTHSIIYGRVAEQFTYL